MKKIVVISTVFALLIAFTACEKNAVGPNDDLDGFAFCSSDCGNDDMTRQSSTDGNDVNNTGSNGPGITDPNEDEDYDDGDDGSITDPDEDEDYDSDDNDGTIVDPDEDEDYDSDDEDGK